MVLQSVQANGQIENTPCFISTDTQRSQICCNCDVTQRKACRLRQAIFTPVPNDGHLRAPSKEHIEGPIQTARFLMIGSWHCCQTCDGLRQSSVRLKVHLYPKNAERLQSVLRIRYSKPHYELFVHRLQNLTASTEQKLPFVAKRGFCFTDLDLSLP